MHLEQGTVMKNKKLFYSKDIVARHNISYPTVTHYTNLGLFTVVDKKGNKRLYDEEEVRNRLGRIRGLMKKGYPLRLIREEIIGRGR